MRVKLCENGPEHPKVSKMCFITNVMMQLLETATKDPFRHPADDAKTIRIGCGIRLRAMSIIERRFRTTEHVASPIGHSIQLLQIAAGRIPVR
jgi:hypothetical protein